MRLMGEFNKGLRLSNKKDAKLSNAKLGQIWKSGTNLPCEKCPMQQALGMTGFPLMTLQENA